MSSNDLPPHVASTAQAMDDSSEANLLSPLLQRALQPAPEQAPPVSTAIPGIVIGELLALADDGETPLVRYAGQTGSAALSARTTVDIHAAHIGRPVILIFDRGQPERPIVIGVLRDHEDWSLRDRPAQVQVDSDGQRLIVSARDQLVLRCGKASITLTKAGKVLIEGSYLLSRSTGVNRIKGGSVQLN